MKTPLHYLIAARQSEIAELEQISRASTLVASMSELVHALQKERGLSNIFLVSSGALAQQALLAHGQHVDQVMGRVCVVLEELGERSPGAHGARLFNSIANALQGFEALPQLRHQRDALQLSAEDCMQALIRIIAACLTVVYEAADSACDPDIAKLLVALFHFMQGKELAGQERATGVAAFTQGISKAERQRHWLHLIESQDGCFQVFADFASPQGVERWQQQCGACTDMTVIERLRRIGCTAADGAPLDKALSSPWFEACSSRLDAMHQIEAFLAQELQAQCLCKLELSGAALSQQQALLETLPEPLVRAESGVAFILGTAQGAALPAEGVYGRQLGKSIVGLVQEQAARLQDMQTEIDKARSTLKERKTIERAKGVLMNYRQLGEGDAYKLIRQTAMNQNRRMLDVAEAILATVDLLPCSTNS
ncbi:nitrate- and nitrite sensing domain-containing protein [Comamonas sp. Y33R10-2]|uniref:nitrate regulatory protein n=1 Tax=Comamonas sp. Y33R10-2 TaxID=2853257 RepID=UPI001C5CB960|nr:nitrate regulatory protein [Comamonas sp. Y33R10-2]QXZ09797.1 nitrate- and nitrite sensing domain-containing protein [Comamonas sp. Y33R10-2]